MKLFRTFGTLSQIMLVCKTSVIEWKTSPPPLHHQHFSPSSSFLKKKVGDTTDAVPLRVRVWVWIMQVLFCDSKESSCTNGVGCPTIYPFCLRRSITMTFFKVKVMVCLGKGSWHRVQQRIMSGL